MAGGWGTGTLACAVGWPRVHNRRSGATLCSGTDAVPRNPRHTGCCGKNGAAAGSGTLYLAGSLARGALSPLLRLPLRTIGALGPAFAVTQGPTARTEGNPQMIVPAWLPLLVAASLSDLKDSRAGEGGTNTGQRGERQKKNQRNSHPLLYYPFTIWLCLLLLELISR